ncbi:prohibitin family protein [Flavilitoribacter nigricans]|uniref:Peptidase n=1 Tax=Flavilitoribacter nigricans (strain ATCC 23147 / DSM 23189 / NBRC 102662 / NCIMB 1420 / SS-2) TaxID=1122177 RepID=A0A2D0MY68_FLAN2|nr:prohibitin family protein [Flavilitoribacter nigricans]PHN00839.1 peptidase [Flavilitoribacter nigricans DSM 23189 = NBRC 102662]
MSEARNRGNANPQSKMISWGVIAFVLLILIIGFSNATFLTIDAGERGVLFRRFSGGLDRENIYEPGFHIIAPWNVMYVYDVREQQVEEEMEVLSSNGLNISVDVTVRVNPKYDKIAEIHEKFGPDYVKRLVIPETRSSVREMIGQFTPEELYSTKRDEVQKLIQGNLAKALDNNYVELRATLIRDIELPEKVRTAIEEKLEAEQSALKYEYILDQERKEAERKIIEAQAKADANKILNASLTDKILQDKGIEATLELANSPNSKVIIVGGNGDGLPLILGGN